ncbi:hypothetical protein AOQ84DRAFT_298220 [Glonium stellatum]|uniref:Rhodopsin domain-containing protein n=1 Tax=Glonium stellatum TaxID=574774 RepID=A0A8E2EWB4_9PEZI|nr:hypothetical protein AOQ84DRAFT_298220 [Glonium stellatum]
MSLPLGVDLNQTLAATPLPGATPDLGGGESLGPTLIIISCIMIPIMIVVVICRTVASYRTPGPNGGLGWAEYTSIGAAVIIIAQASVDISLHNHMRHQWNTSVGSLDASYFKAESLMAWPAIFLAKVAILLLYLRIFEVKRSIRVGAIVGAIWAFLAYIPNIIVSGYFCAPHIDQPWDFRTGLTCDIPGVKEWLVTSAVMSLALDIFILILPILIVLRLHLNVKRRLGVFLIFFTAIFAVVCALLTLMYRVRLLLYKDAVWVGSQLFITNVVENYIAIIVGAIPGVTSYFKTFVTHSIIFSQLSSRITNSFGSFGRSSRG